MLAVALVTVLLATIHIISAQELEIVFSQVIYRHGDRSPHHGVDAYPKNPIPQSVWPQGLSQLTPLGMQKMYELGQYFRRRYILGHPYRLLNSSYRRVEIYVRSTDRDRALQSAQLTLAAMYPPTGDQVWKRGLNWQPIPVHTIPWLQDYWLNYGVPDVGCLAYTLNYTAVLNTPEVLEEEARNQYFYEYIHNVTGLQDVSIGNVWEIGDILNVQRIHNYPSPAWANRTWENGIPTFDKLLKLINFTFEVGLNRLDEPRLRGGPLLGLMLKNMQDKVNTSLNSTLKHIAYSAHGDTMVGLMAVLGVWDGIVPNYSSAFMVELLRCGPEYFVKMYYMDDTELFKENVVVLPGCTESCSLDQFTELVQDRFPVDYYAECNDV